ncbi:hypothetical protein NKH18_03450 [Streptomyces sp. M10(2022)]
MIRRAASCARRARTSRSPGFAVWATDGHRGCGTAATCGTAHEARTRGTRFCSRRAAALSPAVADNHIVLDTVDDLKRELARMNA